LNKIMEGKKASYLNRIGEIVWAKIEGYPFWPSLVWDPRNCSEEVQREAVMNIDNSYCVYFYDCREYGFTTSKNTISFLENESAMLKQKIKKSEKEGFDLAYKLAKIDSRKTKEERLQFIKNGNQIARNDFENEISNSLSSEDEGLGEMVFKKEHKADQESKELVGNVSPKAEPEPTGPKKDEIKEPEKMTIDETRKVSSNDEAELDFQEKNVQLSHEIKTEKVGVKQSKEIKTEKVGLKQSKEIKTEGRAQKKPKAVKSNRILDSESEEETWEPKQKKTQQ